MKTKLQIEQEISELSSKIMDLEIQKAASEVVTLLLNTPVEKVNCDFSMNFLMKDSIRVPYTRFFGAFRPESIKALFEKEIELMEKLS